ncbi:MAG TPA: hypothetical protein VGP15_09070 [Burkholderiales bacterium]|nr:hypothetical protein [Burkholderiales bacterium]
MIKQICAVTFAAILLGGSAIAGETKSDATGSDKRSTTSLAGCEKMTGAERDSCMRAAKAKDTTSGGTAGTGTGASGAAGMDKGK